MPFIGQTIVPTLDTNAGDAPGQLTVRQNSDGSSYVAIRCYNNSGSALVKGQIYVVSYSGTAGQSPQVITVAASATISRRIAVAIDATASAKWAYFAVDGFVDAMIEGTTAVVKGDYLKAVSSTSSTAFIKDSSTAIGVGSLAIATAAQGSAGNVLTRVQLLGERAVINS